MSSKPQSACLFILEQRPKSAFCRSSKSPQLSPQKFQSLAIIRLLRLTHCIYILLNGLQPPVRTICSLFHTPHRYAELPYLRGAVPCGWLAGRLHRDTQPDGASPLVQGRCPSGQRGRKFVTYARMLIPLTATRSSPTLGEQCHADNSQDESIGTLSRTELLP